MYQHKKGGAVLCAFLALATASCSIPKKTTLRKPQAPPAVYSAAADTSAGIARLRREEFFKDPKLQTVIKDVLQRNPDMRIAMERIKVAGAYFRMSRGALLPTLAANASAGGTRYGRYTMEGVGNFDTNLSPNIDDDQRVNTNLTPLYLLGLSTTWEIDVWGRLRSLKEAARLRYLASAEGARWVRSTLTTQAASLYYELVALDYEGRIVDENIALQRRALEIVEAQKEGGRATELAVQQFRAQLLNTQAEAHDILRRKAEAEATLNALAGRYNGIIPRSDTLDFRQHFDTVITSGVPATLLQARPDIREAQAELEASGANIAAARAAFFPTVNISAYTAFNSFNAGLLFGLPSVGFQLLGGVTAPIFQQHRIRSQYNIATAESEQAFYALERTALGAYREVSIGLATIQATDSMLSLKRGEAAALDRAVDVATDLYVAGYASYLEIVTAQRSKVEAELQLARLQRDRIQAVLELYKSLGGGWQ